MGKGRGKGKRFSVTNEEDIVSGEEEKIPVQKKRGRPLKLKKEEINNDEYEKVGERDTENAANSVSTMTENGRKRKAKGDPVPVKMENDVETRSSAEESTKPNGFRHNGSRRKSKPCRAAEAGVECKQYVG